MTSSSLSKYGLITTILLLAVFLRILGIWHDYPYSFYPDEAHFVKRALSFGSFDFNPHWFHKPAFYMYILFFEYGLYFIIGKVIGLWNSISDFAVSYIKNPGPFYIIGRLTTTLFSIGSIWVVYRLGEGHFKPGVGIIAALFLGLSYGHVAASQNVKADTLATFFAIVSMLFLLKYIKEENYKDIILSAVTAGMGAATKIYPIVMLVPLTLGTILMSKNKAGRDTRWIQKALLLIGIIVGIFYLSYFVCAPYSFLDPLGRKSTFSGFHELMEKIRYFLFKGEKIIRPDDFIGQRMSYLQGSFDYFKKLLEIKGTGVIIGGIGLSGFGYLILKLNMRNFLFLLYPVTFIFVSILVNPGYAESRHQLSVYPFLAISGGALVMAIRGKNGLQNKIIFAILLISLVFPLYKIIERGLYISREDTRNIAKAWIESTIPAGIKILVDENGPQLLMDEENIKRMLQKAKMADPKGQFTAHYDTYLQYQLFAAENSVTYDIYEIRLPWWREKLQEDGIHELDSDYDKDMGNPLKPVGVMPFKYYKENGYKYVIVSSKFYGLFLKEDSREAKKFPSFYHFYSDLFREASQIKEFSPTQGHSKGPVIKIFKIQ